jgi:colanic acid/amylovoran biosynthesis glycosyltransferase
MRASLGESVVIYRNDLLPVSETFILAQTSTLRRFTPLYVGLRRATPSLPLPEMSKILSHDSGLAGIIQATHYPYTGWGPGLHRSLTALRPALIHAHFAPDGTNALALKRALNSPLIVTLHGYDVTIDDGVFRRSLRGRNYLRRRSRLWKEASCFLCVSSSIRASAIARGFPVHKLINHYIGVDCALFRPIAFGERDHRQIVFVGRLVEKKGCEYLLRAMGFVQAMHPEAHAIIIGDGPLRARLEAHAKALGIRANFLGAQPSHVVRSWVSKARLLCNPSVTASTGDSEGFGMVFAEAQAMGTPVVSTFHGGIPEAVLHGMTGLLANERDVVGLAMNIHRLLADDEFWQACSDRAITHVRDNFDLYWQTGKLEAIYDEVIRGYAAKSG